VVRRIKELKEATDTQTHTHTLTSIYDNDNGGEKPKERIVWRKMSVA